MLDQLRRFVFVLFVLIYRYAKALVQEMNVNIDKGFIISMASLFSQQKELLEEVLCQVLRIGRFGTSLRAVPLSQLSPLCERKQNKKIGEKNKSAPRENWEPTARGKRETLFPRLSQIFARRQLIFLARATD